MNSIHAYIQKNDNDDDNNDNEKKLLQMMRRVTAMYISSLSGLDFHRCVLQCIYIYNTNDFLT